jgi:ferrochelatase
VTAHVVLVTYGEPPTPAFGAHLAYSWRILLGLTRTIADIPRPLLPVIALARARARNRSWKAEGYGSPLEDLTRLQAGRLEAVLSGGGKDGVRWNVHVAYEFREPLLARLLDRLPPDEEVTVVPMYAAESAFTHALSRGVVEAVLSRRRRPAPVRVLPALDPEVLGDACARHVLELTADDERWRGPGTAVVLAAHGTLLEPKRRVDNGLAATEAIIEAIRRRLAPCFGLVVPGWLNHVRGGRWTEPSADEALRQVAAAGLSRVVYFPYGFLADNAESQLEGRVALRSQPRLEARHLPCLNGSPLLIDPLAKAVARSRLAPGG